MATAHVALALLTGLIAGGLFSAVEAPIPAPPNLAGVLGIVGIYLGYRIIDTLGYTVDVTRILGG